MGMDGRQRAVRETSRWPSKVGQFFGKFHGKRDSNEERYVAIPIMYACHCHFSNYWRSGDGHPVNMSDHNFDLVIISER